MSSLGNRAQEMSQAQEQVIRAEKMAALGRLAAAVAHELNNPLSAIAMYARLAERGLDDVTASAEAREELCRYLSQVQTDARRCGVIVSSVLHFARSSSREFAQHHLNDVVTSSIALVRHFLQIAHVVIETHPLAGDDALSCDADQLQQALVALLVNAAECLSVGGRLGVRLSAEEAALCIEICWSPSNGTLQLGLPGVEMIVHRHGGRIEIGSTADGGTRTRVLLPRQTPCSAPASTCGAAQGSAPEVDHDER